MNTHPVGQRESGLYEIRLQGRLHERWLAWFDGMTLTSTSEASSEGLGRPAATGTSDNGAAGVVTTLRGPIADQAALHGMLARLRDCGMPLISVARVEPRPDDEPDAPAEGGR